jgi:nucleoside-triphosphatase THEP1
MSNKILILTAEKQTGKTTLLQQFCKDNNDVAGILTPIVNGKRVFYNITGAAYFEMEANKTEAQLVVGNYIFSAAGFKKANDMLMQESKRNDINYLIIDEIGPLETKYQQGFYTTLISLLKNPFNYNLLLVVRPSLVDEVLSYAAVNKQESIVMNLAKMSAYLK